MTQVDGNTTVQGDIKLNYQSDIYTPPPVVYLRIIPFLQEMAQDKLGFLLCKRLRLAAGLLL